MSPLYLEAGRDLSDLYCFCNAVSLKIVGECPVFRHPQKVISQDLEMIPSLCPVSPTWFTHCFADAIMILRSLAVIGKMGVTPPYPLKESKQTG